MIDNKKWKNEIYDVIEFEDIDNIDEFSKNTIVCDNNELIDSLESENDDLFDNRYSILENKPKIKIFTIVKLSIFHILLYILNYFITYKCLENKGIYDILMSVISSSFVAFVTYYISEYFNRMKEWKKDINIGLKDRLEFLVKKFEEKEVFEILNSDFNKLLKEQIQYSIERQEYANYVLIAFICYLIKNKSITKISQERITEIKTLHIEFKELEERMRINVDEDYFKKYTNLQRKSSLLAYGLSDSFQKRYMKNFLEIRYQL